MTTLVTQATIEPSLYNTLATLSDSQTLTNKTIKSTKEPVTIVNAAPSSTTNFDVVTQAISVYNTATNNFTINVRGNASTTLSSLLAVGESTTVSLFVPNGFNAYFASGYQVDGVAVTPKYQGGIPYTSGNANCTDLYVLFIVKLANNSWSLYVSQTRFA